MRIPEPDQLPSGMWRARIMIDKKRTTKIFETRTEALQWLAQSKTMAERKARPTQQMTVGEAIDLYIDSKSAILSPTTIANYKMLRKTHLQDIMGVKLQDLDQSAVQRSVNILAMDHAPKTVRNAHGLLSATLRVYKPDLVLNTTMPQPKKHDISIPTESEVKKIASHVAGSDFEIPFLLAAWMGLRASEICGLTWDCVEQNGKILHVKQAMVFGGNSRQLKTTKTYSSDRRLQIPKKLQTLIKKAPHAEDDDFIVHIDRHAMFKRLSRACEHLELPHYRFHDLRHYYASMMLSIGIPDKYAMEQMGHSSTHMLKQVYQHTMDDTRKKLIDKLNEALQK